MIHFHLGYPIQIDEVLKQNKKHDVKALSKLLRRVLATHIIAERRVLTGPLLQPRSRIIASIMRENELRSLIYKISKGDSGNVEENFKKAEKILKEISSDYHPTFINIFYYFLRWLTHRLFEKMVIDQKGIAQLKEEISAGPVLLVPNHKSHMDYLIISYALFVNQIAPPHILAGNNLSFFQWVIF